MGLNIIGNDIGLGRKNQSVQCDQSVRIWDLYHSYWLLRCAFQIAKDVM